MKVEIKNLKEINLDEIVIPNHSCMPDLAEIEQETWCVLDGHTLLATYSLWVESAPAYENYKTGLVGNFFATNLEDGRVALEHACARLREHGCNYAIGPMNGDTWHSYRLVTDAGDSVPFFMEYFTPISWPRIFADSGFEKIAHYLSAKTEGQSAHRDQELDRKIDALRLTVRSFDLTNPERELEKIHALSMVSFAKNFLYTDISLEAFKSMYMKIIPYVDPDFFIMVEDGGKLVGFAFAGPDFLQKKLGREVDTIIFKSIARSPEKKYAGLGAYLFEEIHERAFAKGYHHVIHALMLDKNVSNKISAKTAKPIRRYALYGRKLSS